MYMDVYNGWNPEFACANAKVSWEKPEYGKRLSFIVDIPDYLIEPKVDVIIPETAKVTEVI